MIIALDLDGVCYEWQRTYRYMLKLYFGVVLPAIEKFWTYWDAPDQYTTQEQRDWMWTEGVKRGLFRYGHMVKDCRVACERLHAVGHQLMIVTSRPESAAQDTHDWVDFYFKGIPLADRVLLHNEESKATVAADVLIDDKVENILEWANTGRFAILFQQPWNEERYDWLLREAKYPEKIVMVKGWDAVGTAIRTIEAYERGWLATW
jgi:5'(3')-deoxyribonucleotidase